MVFYLMLAVGLIAILWLIYIGYRNDKVLEFRVDILIALRDSGDYMNLIKAYDEVSYNRMLLSHKKLKVENYYPEEFCEIINKSKKYLTTFKECCIIGYIKQGDDVMQEDVYLDDRNCLDRLKKEHEKYGKLIVALDFDYTIHDYRGEGLKFPKVIDLIKECNKLDFDVVIFTANKNHEQIKWKCHELGIKFKGININILPEFEGSGKIFYSILLDDRAGLSSAYNILKAVVDEVLIKEGLYD